jgi:hypothetical protein
MTLLAFWNVTDADGTARNTVHIDSTSSGAMITESQVILLSNRSPGNRELDLDLTFLQCSLQWDVCTTDSYTGSACAVGARECMRDDAMPPEQKIDPVTYNWTSVVRLGSTRRCACSADAWFVQWAQGISWNDGLNATPGVSVISGVPSLAEE